MQDAAKENVDMRKGRRAPHPTFGQSLIYVHPHVAWKGLGFVPCFQQPRSPPHSLQEAEDARNKIRLRRGPVNYRQNVGGHFLGQK